MRSVSAIPSVRKSYIYMATVLATLSAGSDDSSLDELLFFKEAMSSPYGKDFEKVMHAEFQIFIENNTWEYRNAP